MISIIVSGLVITIINQYTEGFYWFMPLSDLAITRLYLMPCILIVIAAITLLAVMHDLTMD